MAGDDGDGPLIGEDNEEEMGEQIRVSFLLDSSVSDRSLEVPSEPIAVPSNIRRKGLSAVINHLLDRVSEDDQDERSDDDEEEKLSAIPFDFLVENKLLRTGVETAARRYGLSLEEAIELVYFPAQEAPESQVESKPMPDWISTMSLCEGVLCTGGYDGSIRIHESHNDNVGKRLLKTVTTASTHEGPIKCLSVAPKDEGGDGTLWIATGALDQNLMTHVLNLKTKELQLHAKYCDGHTSSIGCVDIQKGGSVMASGDWDGGLCLWDLNAQQNKIFESKEEPTKKQKTGSSTSRKSNKDSVMTITPKAVFQAHASQISGVSWEHHPQSAASNNTLVTGSWDHSLKVWDVERQDCLLTLNGSRVVACLDMSYHSPVAATGHPDCTVRLWDVRTGNSNSDGDAAAGVSDTTLKPCHKGWVSAVQWSPTDPYVLASTSHDGTIKIWDIRSSLPLHSVRAHGKEDKGLCLVYGDGVIYTGGTDCVVKQYAC